MAPRNDRSIRNIPVPANHRRSAPTHDREEAYITPRRRRSRRWLWITLGVVTVSVLGGLLLSTVFAGANVVVYPRTASIETPVSLTAQPNAQSGLGYITMTISRSSTTTVPASGTQKVSRAASGIITIYNSYGVSSQRLITNTRFEAQDGKIYRVHDPVVVPGATKKADGTLNPGTISVSVFADSPGAEYNRSATRFTIPGFKGDPRYNAFYAETQAISGGFVGTEPAVAGADLARAHTELEQSLRAALESGISSQLPEGFVLIGSTLSLTFSDISQSAGAGNTATLAQTATGITAILRLTDLAAAVAQKQIDSYNGEAVGFADPSTLSIAAASTTKPVGPLDLVLSGSPTLEWQFDPAAVKAALVGKPKSSLEGIIESFKPAIASAEAKASPFWQGNFPGDAEKISVTIGQRQ